MSELSKSATNLSDVNRELVERARAVPANVHSLNIITFSERLTEEQKVFMDKTSREIAENLPTTEVLDFYINKDTGVHELTFKSSHPQNFLMAIQFKFIKEFKDQNIVTTLLVKSFVQVSTVALREWVVRDHAFKTKVQLLVAEHKAKNISEEESRQIILDELVKVANYSPEEANTKLAEHLGELARLTGKAVDKATQTEPEPEAEPELSTEDAYLQRFNKQDTEVKE